MAERIGTKQPQLAADVQVHSSWKRSPDGALQWEQPYGFQEKLYAKIAVPAGERGLFLLATWVSFKYRGPSQPRGTKNDKEGKDKKGAGEEDEIARRLRRAWIRMRHRFPALGAVAGPRGKVYRGFGSAGELTAWADATFRVRRAASAPDLFRDLTRTEHITLWYLPEFGELLLQTEHHHLDGRGIMHFWDTLFATLAADDDDETRALTFERDFAGAPEAARLPPRSDDVLDLREEAPGRGREVALEMLAPLELRQGEEQVCLPVDLDRRRSSPSYSYSAPGRASGPPGRNFSEETRLSVRDTRAVVDACKRRGYTVTSAWHAALVLAARGMQVRRRDAGAAVSKAKFMGFSNFDLRAYFPRRGADAAGPESKPQPKTEETNRKPTGTTEPQPGDGRYSDADAYTVSNHHTVLPIALDVSAGRGFDDLARELTAFYRRGIPRRLWGALPRMIDEVLPSFVPGGADMEDTTPAVSSLGNVDAFIGKRYGPSSGSTPGSSSSSSSSSWEIEDVWFGDTATGPWLECFMWAWRGRLVLCSCYSSAFYTPRDVLAFHDDVADTLMQGLGLFDERAPRSRI